ncbi:MAG: hypothetical protein KDD04_06550 [Sinomicrobium sp.]|nr:hypothetical protein [Sinomicrobium sp.]
MKDNELEKKRIVKTSKNEHPLCAGEHFKKNPIQKWLGMPQYENLNKKERTGA